MIFKCGYITILSILLLLSNLNAKEPEESGERKFSMGVLRPVIERSDFLSGTNIEWLRRTAGRSGYNLRGEPIFKSIYTRKLGVFETKLAQSVYYARDMNKIFWEETVSKDLPHWRKILHPETISKYGRRDFRVNPVLIDGRRTAWHHGLEREFLLVDFKEHAEKIHRVGGNVIWGEKAKKTLSTTEIFKLTASRWVNVVAIDLAWSSSLLWFSGERDWCSYTTNVADSIIAGNVAWITESLIVSKFPLSAGNSPLFIPGGSVAIPTGGVVAVVAAIVFAATKELIRYAWNEYQRREAERVEALCKKAENEFRILLFNKGINENTEKLRKLLN